MQKMKKEIEEKYAAVPDGQISPGIYLKKVGTKYVHVLNIWDYTKVVRIPIGEFYDRFVSKRPGIL